MRWILAVLLVTAACKKSEPVPVDDPVPAPHARVVTDPELGKTVENVLNSPPEPVSAKTAAAAKDPAPVLGEWTIRNMQSTINGKVGAVDEPIVPGSWVLTADGKYKKLGGNELEGTYVFTGDHLVISALGPALDYEIKKLTKAEMILVQRIEGVDIANETRFDRKK